MTLKTGRASRLERITLRAVAVGAIVVALGAVIAVTLQANHFFRTENLSVEFPLHGTPDATLSEAAGVVDAEFSTTIVTFNTTPTNVRWLLFAEQAAPALAAIGVCFAVWWLVNSLIGERAFRRSMPAVLALAGLGVVLAGTLTHFLGAIGRAELVEQLGDYGAEAGMWEFLFELDLAPLGWGVALAVVSAAFEVGQRLQKDAEGLV